MTEGKIRTKDVSINLNCYTIRFRKKNEKDNYLKLEEALSGRQFKDFTQDFIKSLETETYVNDKGDRILYLSSIISVTPDLFSGTFKRGYSTHKTDIDELNTGKAKTIGSINIDQYNSTPFYFCIALPRQDAYGLVFIAQSYKQFGFKEIFEEAFKKFFIKHFNNEVLCEMGTLSIAALFDKYVNDGNIKKLRFKRHMLTENIENLLKENNDKDSANYEMELSIKARERGFLGIKKNISSEGSSFLEIFKIDGFDYDEALADISVNGRTRVLSISNPSSFSASYDITSVSDINKLDKLPNFDKVNEEAISILKNEIIPNIKL